ncbi:MAG: hypothetical protein CL676_02115 [Bdellovibrionaceae bacterium]|nr:hypothetical protein [Pseudobdellovibrionaceae bacterium]
MARLILYFIFCVFAATKAFAVDVASKNFTESYILAQLAADTLSQEDIPVSTHLGLGGTGFVLESLLSHSIDVYPDYTGTLLQVVLKSSKKQVSIEDLNQMLDPMGIAVSESLGFNNTYALIVRKETAAKYKLKTVSDLKKVSSKLNGGFSHEFTERKDGLKPLRAYYKIPPFRSTKGMDHSLAYEALNNGSIDVTDAYTTDGKLAKFDFVLLEDDLGFFPDYQAVWVTRKDFIQKNPKAWAALTAWSGKIDEKLMTKLNADVEEKRATVASVGMDNGLVEKKSALQGRMRRISNYAVEHSVLVLVSVFLAIVIGFPLAYGATENNTLKHIVMLMSSAFQTVPSLALLCFLIPFFGVGFTPSIIALVLYALLPIVVNSYTGLSLIDKTLLDMSRQLGMNKWQALWHVQIPIALPYILAGVKTSSITAIGTATLAALIGAGGFGTPILAGLALNNYTTIMEGAIPVCLMAFLVQLLFQVMEKKLVSPGLY